RSVAVRVPVNPGSVARSGCHLSGPEHRARPAGRQRADHRHCAPPAAVVAVAAAGPGPDLLLRYLAPEDRPPMDRSLDRCNSYRKAVPAQTPPVADASCQNASTARVRANAVAAPLDELPAATASARLHLPELHASDRPGWAKRLKPVRPG